MFVSRIFLRPLPKAALYVGTMAVALVVWQRPADNADQGQRLRIVVKSAPELSAAHRSNPRAALLLMGGEYGAVSMNGRNTLPVTLIAADPRNPPTFEALHVHNAKGVSLSGIKINPLAEPGQSWAGYGLLIDNSQDVTVVETLFTGGPEGRAKFAYGFKITNSSNVTLDKNTFTELGFGGHFSNVKGITVTGNLVTNNRATGFNFGIVENVEIARNTITNMHPDMAAGDHPDGIQFMTPGTTLASKNIYIHDNVLSMGDGKGTQGIFIVSEGGGYHTNVRIENNQVSTGAPLGIAIANVIGGSISGNTVVNSNGILGQLHVSRARNVTISKNTSDAIGLVDVKDVALACNVAQLLGLTNVTNLTESNNTVATRMVKKLRSGTSVTR